MSEPAGSPGGTANFDAPAPYPAGIALTATHDKKNGEYILNGRKRWPVNSGGWDLQGADTNVCIVRTAPEAGGSRGLSAIIVPRGTPEFPMSVRSKSSGIGSARTIPWCSPIAECPRRMRSRSETATSSSTRPSPGRGRWRPSRRSEWRDPPTNTRWPGPRNTPAAATGRSSITRSSPTRSRKSR